MWKKILIGLVVIIILFVVGGLLLPTEYEVSRSIAIDAKTSKIHDWVNNLKKWEEWMPWTEDNPSVEVVYGKRTEGVGASQTWTEKDGQGEIVVTASDKNRGIEYDMSYNQGELKSKGSILYEEVGKTTRVTWTMSGDMSAIPVLGSYMRLLMEPQIGKAFERGLAKLKTKVEGE